MDKKTFFAVFKTGERISQIETLCLYALPFLLLSTSYQSFLWTNFLIQLAIFIPLVQIPAYLTGKMSWVDIGWPVGLTVLGFTGLYLGDGYSLRKWLWCICYILHGGRMALGGILILPKTIMKTELPRYRTAKERWIESGQLESTFWMKIQQETFTQCLATSFTLCTPLMLAVFNKNPSLNFLDYIGLIGWAASYFWENKSDIQKDNFIRKISSMKREVRADAKMTDEQKLKKQADLDVVVLGYAPFDGPEHSCWVVSRHPNYFGEWMCWFSFGVGAVGNL